MMTRRGDDEDDNDGGDKDDDKDEDRIMIWRDDSEGWLVMDNDDIYE